MDTSITKRQAIRIARKCADSLIEQLERRAKGWDKGRYRDDDAVRICTIRQSMELDVAEAFHLSRQFRGL